MDFHGRMVNIPSPVDAIQGMAQQAIAEVDWDEPDAASTAAERAYRYGHRDARHAAAEIANEADRRIRELEGQIQEMVQKAADSKLDGYRELGERVAKAENERDALHARVAELEAELSKIDDEAGLGMG